MWLIPVPTSHRQRCSIILRWKGMMVGTAVHAPVPLGQNTSVERLGTSASTQKLRASTTTTSPLLPRPTVCENCFQTGNVTPATTTNSVVCVTVFIASQSYVWSTLIDCCVTVFDTNTFFRVLRVRVATTGTSSAMAVILSLGTRYCNGH